MNAAEKILAQVRAMVPDSAQRLGDHFEASTRPHLARIMEDAAIVAVRAAAGEDVGTATVALDSSLKSIARENQAIVIQESRTLALQAAIAVIKGLLL